MARISKWLCLIVVGLAGVQHSRAQAGTSTLSNATLEAAFDSDRAILEVRDKRNGYVWRQNPTALSEAGVDIPAVHVKSVKEGNGIIYAGLEGENFTGMKISLGPEEATLYVEVQAEGGGSNYGAMKAFPSPFVMEPESGYVVQCTPTDGAIFPMSEISRMRNPFSFTGCMPWYGVTDLRKGCIGVLTSFCQQSPIDAREQTAEFPMKIRYHFVTDGGYVALAKYYRAIAETQGKLVTLQKKMAANANFAKMIGAPVIYLWGPGNQKADLIRKLKADGVDRAMVACGRVEDAIEAANSAGYLPFMYDLYSGDTCASQILTAAMERVTQTKATLDLEGRFYDTLIPRITPCESPEHPMTIEEARDARREVLRWTLEDMKTIPGSGEGRSPDWAVPVLGWMEGQMTLRPYVSVYLDKPYTQPNGREDWRSNRVEPAVVCKDAPVDPTFYDYEVNPARRVPLFGLVYHDCVVTTWNWRCSNHRYIGGQTAKDLMNILYGNAPMWCLSPQIWAEKKIGLVAGYHNVCDWTKEIFFDEMTNHQWLSPDRKVAMTSFSSGWNAAVNLTEADFKSEFGVVKAMSFLTWKD